ncbi:hypothetical protein [Paraburkholderia guartelaensis]|uniref:Uncharacterized protein n=1 Tax=Paraburkholderia guartelaensis TaxID=2546446 RepID=A0ABU9S6R6_9BURK
MIWRFDRRVGQLLPPQVGLSDRFVRAAGHVLLQCDRTVVDFLAGNRLVAQDFATIDGLFSPSARKYLR